MPGTKSHLTQFLRYLIQLLLSLEFLTTDLSRRSWPSVGLARELRGARRTDCVMRLLSAATQWKAHYYQALRLCTYLENAAVWLCVLLSIVTNDVEIHQFFWAVLLTLGFSAAMVVAVVGGL